MTGVAEGGEPAPAGSIGGDPILPTPIVLGGLATKDVQVVVDAAKPAFDACFAAAHAKDPKLAGKVSVRFAIGAEGRVGTVRTKSTSLWNTELETCLNTKISTLTFPKPSGGSTAIVTWPFSFPG